MIERSKTNKSISIVVAGSGGTGAMTTGNTLFDTAAKIGWYGTLTRTLGPQIRGGEAAAMLRLTSTENHSPDDIFNLLLAIDWKNVERFAPEIPLNSDSLIICDKDAGEVPEVIANSGARIIQFPIKKTARKIKSGRPNMIALGILAQIADLPEQSINDTLTKKLEKKGQEAIQSSLETVALGRELAKDIPQLTSLKDKSVEEECRWIISGNEAVGLGAINGGVRFVAAYPITPATEVLEWMAAALPKVGGTLVQAEDELSSVNMIIGASYGGIPSLTSTSGPGLALMVESIGLAVASEVPLVVVNVMRGGPSTGIPTKPEQSDLNISVYGLHGDAPHLVVAPLSVKDCIFSLQWTVYLSEAMQVPAIVLSDQFMGQARAVIDKPDEVAFFAKRDVATNPGEDYSRYALTDSGISPMSIPGIEGGQYTADGLEHNIKGSPSTQTEHHKEQMDKRQRKLCDFDYGDDWADISGEGEVAVITWGSTSSAVMEAINRLKEQGVAAKMIAVRLIAPAQNKKMADALKGVKKILVVEQNHSAQYCGYLKAQYEITAEIKALNRPGPLVIKPGEIVNKIKEWC
ncbi:MAG: 2-oxoacid:acceptor oxidoreductase subunit alpha [Gammaproteobacteria bacterium]|nr:2-oxoacid:acceptor oxidoreductase subunit alpha [Gammaproteobacteria bacterium]